MHRQALGVHSVAEVNEIKAIVFDMDGVLIDAREWHYIALNLALSPFGFEISKDQHIERFNGLSTAKKLQILSNEFGLPLELHEIVSAVKQDRTLRIAAQFCFPIVAHQILLSRLKLRGLKLGVVTNSIRDTTQFMLKYANIYEFFDTIVTNQDVKLPKPDSEGYLLACKKLGVVPEETLVIEDGDYGIKAATNAGCRVLRIDNPQDLNIELFIKHLPGLMGE